MKKNNSTKSNKISKISKQTSNLSDYYQKHAYKGKIYFADKTVDELLYEKAKHNA